MEHCRCWETFTEESREGMGEEAEAQAITDTACVLFPVVSVQQPLGY